MPQIKPFNAWRYSHANLTDLICPPYDIISQEEKKKLQKRSTYNIVNIELSDPTETANKYRNAAAIFKTWQKEEILVCDENPAFYLYEQIFEYKGIKMTRRGFFCALKLDDPHSQKGSVKPHEKTLAKPKADRLSLLRATRANVSPIFGLFDDDKKFIEKLCAKISQKRAPNATAFEKQGVVHKIWAVSDEHILKDIEKFLANKKMIIADGHHRYETAWNYSQERKEKDANFSADKDYNFVLAFLCPIEDPGILILPTHRLIDEPADMENNIAKFFDVWQEKDLPKLLKKDVQPLIIFKNNKKRVLTIKNETLLKKAMPKKCKAYRNLAVSILHYILMPKIDPSDFVYVHDDKEAIIRAKKENKIAIIVPATPAKALKAISLNNEMMPQKSTYFYPKLASGLVIRGV
ncbi:MAG: DUF1015 domain-containing protein [Elusimicrobiota bacterium]|nr:DUF1015 domain-containing protein [Elusimicrobiota bacterium]